MTKDELAGVLRAVLAAGAAWAVSKGWLGFLDTETKQALLAAATTALVGIASVRAKRKA